MVKLIRISNLQSRLFHVAEHVYNFSEPFKRPRTSLELTLITLTLNSTKENMMKRRKKKMRCVWANTVTHVFKLS